MGNLLQSPTKSYEFISGEYTAFERKSLTHASNMTK